MYVYVFSKKRKIMLIVLLICIALMFLLLLFVRTLAVFKNLKQHNALSIEKKQKTMIMLGSGNVIFSLYLNGRKV